MLHRYATVILPAAVVAGILIVQAYDAGWIGSPWEPLSPAHQRGP